MNLGSGQDWDQVVIRKKKPTASEQQTDKAVNAARASGTPVETVKKFTAGKNASAAGGSKDAAKLDRETEELHHDRQGLAGSCMCTCMRRKVTNPGGSLIGSPLLVCLVCIRCCLTYPLVVQGFGGVEEADNSGKDGKGLYASTTSTADK